MLRGLSYPEGIITAVQQCILSHRGRIRVERKTLEEQVVASADALSHFERQAELAKFFSPEEVREKLADDERRLIPEARAML